MKSTRLSEQDHLKKINETFDELEARRAEELGNAAQLQEANDRILAEEHERLVQKYGPDHPRVQKIAARLVYTKTMAEGVRAEAERAKTRTVPFTSTAWRVNGRVFDAKGTPQVNLTVSLANADGNSIEPLGYGCTDDRGYYVITVKEDIVKKFEQQSVYLTVIDPNRRKLHTEKQPVVVLGGKIDYRDIYIGVEKSCTPPFRDEGRTPDNLKRKDGDVK